MYLGGKVCLSAYVRSDVDTDKIWEVTQVIQVCGLGVRPWAYG